MLTGTAVAAICAVTVTIANVILADSVWKYAVYFAVYISVMAYIIWDLSYRKVTLVFTNRAERLLLMSVGVYVLCAMLYLVCKPLESYFVLASPISYIFVTAAALILHNFEEANNGRYIAAAKQKLSRDGLMKIGITGSYGKTSTKVFLEQILSKKYNVLATPANYNTPLGISKTAGLLTGDDNMFIAEMGARHTGDIDELVDIVAPDIGIITGLAPQHLETFGDMEHICAEKNKLAQAIPAQGMVFYNGECAEAAALYAKREGGKTLVGTQECCDARISGIIVTDKGSGFTIEYLSRIIKVETSLLGRANIQNLMIAVAVSMYLDISDELILAAVNGIVPTPHRQQLIVTGNGMRIIDDSYNINPIGAMEALHTLSLFEGRHIIYCSGMVELGKAGKEMNRNLGQKIAEVADLVILAETPYIEALISGALLGGMDSANLYLVKNTEEAKELFSELLSGGDTLLIMCDLPECYLI